MVYPNTKTKCKIYSIKKNHISLFTEINFTQKTNSNIPGYSSYKTDHPSGFAHAGTAICISSDIKHYALPGFQEPYIHYTSNYYFYTNKNVPNKIASIAVTKLTSRPSIGFFNC